MFTTKLFIYLFIKVKGHKGHLYHSKNYQAKIQIESYYVNWMLQLAWTISVEDVMSNAPRTASCTWPRPTQPTLLTWRTTNNPVESVTDSEGDACCLACLDGRRRVALTAVIVCVELRSPLLASYRQTVALVSIAMIRRILYTCRSKCIMRNTQSLRLISTKLNPASRRHLKHGVGSWQPVTYCMIMAAELGFVIILKSNVK